MSGFDPHVGGGSSVQPYEAKIKGKEDEHVPLIGSFSGHDVIPSSDAESTGRVSIAFHHAADNQQHTLRDVNPDQKITDKWTFSMKLSFIAMNLATKLVNWLNSCSLFSCFKKRDKELEAEFPVVVAPLVDPRAENLARIDSSKKGLVQGRAEVKEALVGTPPESSKFQQGSLFLKDAERMIQQASLNHVACGSEALLESFGEAGSVERREGAAASLVRQFEEVCPVAANEEQRENFVLNCCTFIQQGTLNTLFDECIHTRQHDEIPGEMEANREVKDRSLSIEMHPETGTCSLVSRQFFSYRNALNPVEDPNKFVFYDRKVTMSIEDLMKDWNVGKGQQLDVDLQVDQKKVVYHSQEAVNQAMVKFNNELPKQVWQG